jgi:predicted  nucleic acid-binding Zn-ribbon protein
MGMNLMNSDQNANSVASLEEGMARIAAKLVRLQDEISAIQAERVEMENKITDAQSRIHKILNRLPKPEDTRQMNLLDGSGGNTSGENA